MIATRFKLVDVAPSVVGERVAFGAETHVLSVCSCLHEEKRVDGILHHAIRRPCFPVGVILFEERLVADDGGDEGFVTRAAVVRAGG